ncbi:Rep protein [Vagococcus fluvialis]|uniref:rolling circle replication-associated protein n=1 Tax=Vagococcus fluvialis TaxID=2738 RepID=UPI00288F8D02|nr:Rep protein [Vagococcus fluvialis]MDT2782829.1 Rep protein [Vagococcus fluvialis]
MGSYNKKIITTEEFLELWEYDKPIFTKGKKVKGDTEKKENPTKRKSFDELSDEEQTERLIRMGKTRLKAKWRLMRLIDANVDDKTSFLTLTTQENIQNREVFMLMIKDFIKRFNYQIYKTKKSKLKIIYVIEKQTRGAYHCHCLIFDIQYIPHKTLADIWSHGYIFINRLDTTLDDIANASRYVGKYLEKAIGDELLNSFGKKSFFFSRNLKKVDESKFYSDEKFDFSESVILYETNYVSKIFDTTTNKMISNPVRYRKIKLSKEIEKNEKC